MLCPKKAYGRSVWSAMSGASAATASSRDVSAGSASRFSRPGNWTVQTSTASGRYAASR